MDRRIVGVRWATTGSATFSLLERELPLRPDEVYFLEVYTSRPYRGRGVYQALAAFSDEHYRQAGFRIGLTSTFPWNKRALRAIQRAGYRPVAVVGRWKVGRWRRDFYRPVSTEGNPRVSP
jgi:GNAT superfamily N-acetyltransferase